MSNKQLAALLKAYLHAVHRPGEVPHCDRMAMERRLHQWVAEQSVVRVPSDNARAAPAVSGSSTEQSATTKA
jgi:hypothetical protein